MTAVVSRWMAMLLLVACAATVSVSASPGACAAFRRKPIASHSRKPLHQLHQFRGGAILDNDDEYDDDEYDSESEEEIDEPIVTAARKLATSAKTVARKRKTATVKSKVKIAMAASSTKSVSVAKKTNSGSMYKRYVPYIVRACLNPFTLLAMTKAYFVSLCDIDYLKEDQSQTLRSALEEKARKQQPASGPTRPKRKMKPGQAKTISDLPQLSA